MNFQTIKVEGIGEVPIIGEVNSLTRRVRYYQEDKDLSVFQPEQAPKPYFSDKTTHLEPIKVANTIQLTIL